MNFLITAIFIVLIIICLFLIYLNIKYAKDMWDFKKGKKKDVKYFD